MSARDYLTIGEVVQRLQPSYPDLSISKVRFLEEEGLITPERTQGGYRKFAQKDVARIEMILRLQREHFFPLAVIREKLADVDRGRIPAELQRASVSVDRAAPDGRSDDGPLPLDDIPSSMGIPVSFVRELAEFGIVVHRCRRVGRGRRASRRRDRCMPLGTCGASASSPAICACTRSSPSARRRCSRRS